MPVREASIKITDDEHRSRSEALLEHIKSEGLSGVVLFDQDYVLYYSGFAFVATERPMAFVMNAEGERRLFVPRLELEHAQANAVVDEVDHYPEYPDDPHPTQILKEAMEEMEKLFVHFESWRNGNISCFELSDLIHKFHQGAA